MIDFPDFRMPPQMTMRLGPEYWAQDEYESRLVDIFYSLLKRALQQHRDNELPNSIKIDLKEYKHE